MNQMGFIRTVRMKNNISQKRTEKNSPMVEDKKDN